MTTTTQERATSRDDEQLKRLMSYLEADPDNHNLRADAAERALDCGEPALACELLGSDRASLGDRQLGLLGLAQIHRGSFAEARKSFETLVSRGVDDPAVLFNLAWSAAFDGDRGEALAQLTDELTRNLPQAAMLEVRLLHEEEELERAAEAARGHLRRFPDHPGLAATVSVLALDIEDLDLARASAEKGGGHPDALATLGTLALGEQQVGEAVRLFDEALAASPNVPRAWIGRGLAKLVGGDRAAASDIDRGAELFGDHIGSWIAAGWAYLIGGELDQARQRFERALAIDDNFAESHGSLAVVDVLQAHPAEAEKRIAVALRLDRSSFSARFAETLLAERRGDPKAAGELLAKILETPVNSRGDTALAALARLGLS